MDMPKYLESRGWRRDGMSRRYTSQSTMTAARWRKGEYVISIYARMWVEISDDDGKIYEGQLLTEEFADQLMEALGIT